MIRMILAGMVTVAATAGLIFDGTTIAAADPVEYANVDRGCPGDRSAYTLIPDRTVQQPGYFGAMVRGTSAVLDQSGYDPRLDSDAIGIQPVGSPLLFRLALLPCEVLAVPARRPQPRDDSTDDDDDAARHEDDDRNTAQGVRQHPQHRHTDQYDAGSRDHAHRHAVAAACVLVPPARSRGGTAPTPDEQREQQCPTDEESDREQGFGHSKTSLVRLRRSMTHYA